MYITLNITHAKMLILDLPQYTYSTNGGERGTERGVHTLPHTRQAACPADYGGGVGTAEGPGGATKSLWPGEKLCGFCIAEAGCCRYGKGGRVCVYVIKRESRGVCSM